MNRARLCLSIALTLVLAGVAGAVEREFNWVPSGVINVGDRASEAASKYEASGDVQTANLAYKGEKPQGLTGRLVATERFVIHPSSYRGGPAPASLAICRRVDSGALPGPLAVKVGDKEIGKWTIAVPQGDRRLFDAIFVIPQSAFVTKDAAGNLQVQGEVAVTITGEKPAQSLGYRIYTARDWGVLGEDLAGDIAAAKGKATGAKADYLAGVLAEADRDWAGALAAYTKPAADVDKELARLGRVAVRRAKLRVARAAALAKDPAGDQGRPSFDAHYKLGVLAGAWGCWDDALAEMKLATIANPTDADATYRLAEAMEFSRLPIEEWAPIFERAGFLGESDALQHDRGPANVEDVLMAIHTEPVEGICAKFSQESMRILQRDWRYVEQQVYGASRGAWKMRTHYMICGPDSLPWVWQAGWIFLPPDESVPVAGTYDYSIGTAEYGASHAGGVDCGVNGSGGADIGPTRSWEVLLHEWNHEFDWTCISSEQVPGYPPTHDSDNCGKQPIVSMGCGHRSSMRYYIDRAQYRRHEASDPVVSAAFVGKWTIGPVVAAPAPPDTSPDALLKWLTDNKHLTAERAGQLKAEWEGQKKAEKERADKPPVLKSQPPPKPVPDWPAYVVKQWQTVRMLDTLASPEEAKIAAGEPVTGDWKPLDGTGAFVDLKQALPQAPDKCVAYARTFINSPVDREVRIWIGYNDDAALWLNGRKIHRGGYYAMAKWDDLNRPYELAQSGKLVKGWNSLVVKAERGGGDWGFSAHIVDFSNQPVAGLKFEPQLPQGEKCNRYVPPEVGKYYKWAEVKDDFMELTPRLTAADLAKITGIQGIGIAEHRFHLTLPQGAQPGQGSRYTTEMSDKDVELNNYLNWDCEAAAALRYTKDGKARDLVLVRPEYYDEFTSLLSEPAAGKPAQPPGERVLGCIYIPECNYPTTGGSGRTVIVIDAAIGDYPADDLELLGTP
jgi:hypothetical protein